MPEKIAVIGAGSWGTALAVHLAKNGHSVALWVRNAQKCARLKTARENLQYLPGVLIPESVNITNSLTDTLAEATLVLVSVASQGVRDVARAMRPLLPARTILVSAVKGIEPETFLTVTGVLKEELPESFHERICVLSGPSHAEEVSRDIPTAVVAASPSRFVAETVQDICMGPKFRVYTNPDVMGVELGGALKNIIALGAGISDGLGFGDNTKAALMTRGIVEITRLGVAMGAETRTFAGLSGVGDLIVTCTSMHSRNRRAGILIGQGKKLAEALQAVGMAVEGVRTTRAAYHLAKKMGVEMPITNEIYRVLFEEKDPKEAVVDLMLRMKTHEIEEVALNFDW